VLEELGELLGAATFIVFGAVFLGPALGRVSASIVAYAVRSLTVVRMLPVALAMLGTGARPPTLAFVGWFGPRGLASIVFAVLIVESDGTSPRGRAPDDELPDDRVVRARPRRQRRTARTAIRVVARTTRAVRHRDAFGPPGQLATAGGAGGDSGRLDSISERNSFHGALIRANVFGWRACSSRIPWR
jgi:hypothetical protein